jgi:hypothetical protein
MKTAIPLLADIRVASPCHAAWGNMKGDEQTRFCSLCRKNVYNLSEMTRQEAENLIREKEGKLCVRYYQRADGTVLTKDCPIGVAVVRRVLLTRAVTASALLVTVIALFGRHLRFIGPPDAIMGGAGPTQSVIVGGIEPVEAPKPVPMMGDIAEIVPPKTMPIMGEVAQWVEPDNSVAPKPERIQPISTLPIEPIPPHETPTPPK